MDSEVLVADFADGCLREPRGAAALRLLRHLLLVRRRCASRARARLGQAPRIHPAVGSGIGLRRALCTVAFAVAALPRFGYAEQRPLWELGIGPVGLYLPDYRGSNQSRGYVYPFPFVAYRGDYFKVDRDGIRGIFFESDRVELDVSVNGTPPVDSSRNQARQGMPDLDATLEIGPVLGIVLARDRVIDYSYRLRLRLTVRAVIATDFQEAQTQGWVAYPHLNLDLRPDFLGGRWNVGFDLGPMYASQKYNQYFYGVAPQFATLDRPAYDAQGGYSGATFYTSISRHLGKFWVGGYVRYDRLSGAAFEPSPLVKQSSALAGGIAIAWVFAKSGTTVETPD